MKRSPKQIRASMDNGCMRATAALRTTFMKAGHYDFQKRVEQLDAEFRAKVKNAAK